MDFGKELKKAMIDNEIGTVKELSLETGVSNYIVHRLLRNDTSCRLKDLISVAEFLGVKIVL